MPIEYIAHPIGANVRNETAARAIGVVYTNNTLRPIQVVLSMIHTVTVMNSFCLAQLNIGGVGGASWSGWFNTPAVGTIIYGTIVGNIAPGNTYDLVENNLGGTNVILRWMEIDQ